MAAAVAGDSQPRLSQSQARSVLEEPLPVSRGTAEPQSYDFPIPARQPRHPIRSPQASVRRRRHDPSEPSLPSFPWSSMGWHDGYVALEVSRTTSLPSHPAPRTSPIPYGAAPLG